MGRETNISWCDHTFNPWIGCTKVSSGCTNCYAETLVKRWKKAEWGPRGVRVRTSPAYWRQPSAWNSEAARAGVRRRVFCASLADVFEEKTEVIPWRKQLWTLINATQHLDWLLLTKRPENLSLMLPWGKYEDPYPNVWLGVSIEDYREGRRACELRTHPAVCRFISYEPALGPLAESIDLKGFKWLIFGGESGSHYRPCELQWARDIKAQCQREGVAFFFKQNSGPRPGNMTGVEPELQIQQFPEVRCQHSTTSRHTTTS